MPIGPIARRTPAARLAPPGGSAATRCEGRRFRLPTSHRRSGRPDSERFKSIPRTSAAVCGHSRSRQAAILPPRPGQRREIMMHPHLPGPRPLAVPGIGFPQNISIASDVVDRAAFGDLLDIHRGASKPPIDRIQPVLRTRPRCATVVPRRYGMERQQLKLMDMIAAIVGALDKREIFQSVISHTGRQHAQFGVERSHFAAFGDALIWGLEQQFGPAFTPGLKQAWITLYDAVQSEMIRAAQTQFVGGQRPNDKRISDHS